MPCKAVLLALAATLPLPAPAQDNPLLNGETWQALRYDIAGEAPIAGGAGLFEVEAPYRAHDAATVPVRIRQTDPARAITAATVVVDENPAPVAAEFAFGPGMSPIDLELRVRVNQYSDVRVIAATAEGLAMAGRHVKASGGCAAPASRDPEAARAVMGQMKLRSFVPASGLRREAQVMIRHPNYSGLQRDQVSHLFIPAHFISELEIRQGAELLLRMEGGISVSENPVFRFGYVDNGAPALSVTATDTEGNRFHADLPKEGGS
ncbi:quinoprotein dehydrogenase-associated SoxYZ-like carrier [Mangrovicoccus algicola]|uniref:Quinoprotein dehydrogenase-associated SoxYZ-like carrier n=1 Tax=Mangrovicoccus algicola TaxID=2771008 RepID=A0A8J7CVX1_9RHOB|nr:quinoprotein dehydrogenase-associated SoxYZ-like carrier [Mangrovicoccus algicola]MBE3636987.1 quinoprotein dehydrogenase-associated SoxYZ-like carrier [Mangrovicoccus algicola]